MSETLTVGFVPGPGFRGDLASVDPGAVAEALVAEGVAERATALGPASDRIDLILSVEDVTLAEASVILELSARLRLDPAEVVPFIFLLVGERALEAVPARSATGPIQFSIDETPFAGSNVIEFRRPWNAA